VSRSNIMTIIALAVLLLAGWRGYVAWQGGIAPGARYYYFFDTVTHDLVSASAANVPPVKIGGNECVRAFLYSCGSCTEQDRFVGFYEKYTPEMRTKLANASDPMEAMAAAANRGLLQSVDGEHWFPAGSKESLKILERLKCPDGSSAKPCLP